MLQTEVKQQQYAYFAAFIWIRDANFYGLSVVTIENCKNFQFATDYEKLEFFYGNFFKKRNNPKYYQKSAKWKNVISNGAEFPRLVVF